MPFSVVHNIEPVFDSHSKILVLGSFPSVKSRESRFFYGHPQNRFWKVLSNVFKENEPLTIDEKKSLLLGNCIAVWDVIASCEITGSSDSTIKNAVPNDLSRIIDAAPVSKILLNGATAYNLFEKNIANSITLPAVRMPSTSPANAAWSLDRLVEAWRSELLL